MISKLSRLYTDCKRSDTSFFLLIIRAAYYKCLGKNILAHQHVTIKGGRNIETIGVLNIGTGFVGFLGKRDKTLLNIRGKFLVKGNFAIGRGCRFDIGSNAQVEFGKGGYVNPFTLIVIMHQLTIGDQCAISWNCQFLDEDFHDLQYEGRRTPAINGIQIGDHVWIGSNTHIHKGTIIPDGCVVASNSVVKGVFTEKNVLIAGNPARIIKRDINWC